MTADDGHQLDGPDRCATHRPYVDAVVAAIETRRLGSSGGGMLAAEGRMPAVDDEAATVRDCVSTVKASCRG